MSDPLSLLRQVVQAGASLELKDGNYILNGFRLPQDTSTAFKRSVKAEDYYYTLKDLIFCYEHANLSFGEYRKNSILSKVKGLVDHDRLALLSYLSGQVATCPQIDTQVQQSWVSPEPAVEARNSRSRREESVNITQGSSQSSAPSSSALDGHTIRHKRKAEEALGAVAASALDGSMTDLEADRAAVKEIMKDFFPIYSNKAAVFNAPNADFTSVLKIFNEVVLKPQQQQQQHQPPQTNSAGTTHQSTQRIGAELLDVDMAVLNETPTATAAAITTTATPANNNNHQHSNASNQSGTKQKSQRPIIIVPAVFSSFVNMATVKDFLEKGKFIRLTDEQIKQLSFAGTTPTSTTAHAAASLAATDGTGAVAAAVVKKHNDILQRRIIATNLSEGAKIVTYRVTDDPTKLEADDWNRVVAVFVTGQAWQFSRWPAPFNDPVTLCQQVLAVHVAQVGAPLGKVETWACKIVRVDEFKDHINAKACGDIWQYIDDFIRMRKPQLIASSGR